MFSEFKKSLKPLEMMVEINEEQYRLLFKYQSLLLSHNRAINLTAIRDFKDSTLLNIYDSLLFSQYVDNDAAFIDIGTGGGLPGIPLLIVKDNSSGLLVDSIKKKIDAINLLIEELDLSKRTKLSNARVEELCFNNLDSQYDHVVSRAVAKLPILLEYASPLLPINGKAIFSKGNLEDTEFEAGLAVADLVGFEIDKINEFDLPNNYGHRTLLSYTKKHEPLIELPRPVGRAKKRPLA